MDLWKKDKKQEDLYEKAAKTVHICWNFSGFAFPFSAIALEEQPEELAMKEHINIYSKRLNFRSHIFGEWKIKRNCDVINEKQI